MELEQVLTALRNADAAGDVEGAKRLAQIARQLSSGAPAAPAPKPKTSLADYGYSALSGLGSLMQFPGQLYGLATGDMDNAVSNAGQAVSDYAKSQQSAGLKAKQEAQSKAIAAASKDGLLSEAGTAISSTLKDPVLLGNFIAENIPNMIPGFGAARGTMSAGMKIAAKKIAEEGLEGEARAAALAAAQKTLTHKAELAAVGTAAVQQGADIGAGSYEETYKKMVAQGIPAEIAAQRALSMARAAGASGAVISLLAQNLPGARALEKSFAGAQGTGGRVAGAVKGLLGEGISEGVEEGGGKIAQNAALATIDPTQDILQGVGQTVGQASVLGGVLGGAAGVRNSYVGELQRTQEQEQADAKARADAAAQQAVAEQQAAAQKEQRLKDPAYIKSVADDYAQTLKRHEELKAATVAPKDADPATLLRAEQAKAQLAQFEEEELHPKAEAYNEVHPIIKEQERAAAEAKKADVTAPTEAEDSGETISTPNINDTLTKAQNDRAQAIKDADAAIRAGDFEGAKKAQLAAAQHATVIRHLSTVATQEEAPVQPREASDDELKAELTKLQGGVNSKGKQVEGQYVKALRIGEDDVANAHLDRMQEIKKILADRAAAAAEPTRARDAVARTIEDFKNRDATTAGPEVAEPPPAEPLTPAQQKIADYKARQNQDAGKAPFQEQQRARREAAATPLNPGRTDQQTLFPQAPGVQRTSAATVKRRDAMRRELADAVRDAVAAVKKARSKRAGGEDIEPLREKVVRAIDALRNFNYGEINGALDRGAQTKDVAPVLAGTNAPANGLPVSNSGPEGVESQITPDKATPESVQKQLGSLPEKLSPQDEALVQQITNAMPALANAKLPAETVDVPAIEGVPHDRVKAALTPVNALDDVADYLYRLRTGNAAPEQAKRVQEHLDRLERGKRSDTQTPTRETAWGTATKPTETVEQGDMFPDTELQGTIFNSYEDFENYLASDAVQEARRAVGKTLTTIARLQRDLAPLEQKRREFQETVANTQRLLAVYERNGNIAEAQAREKRARAEERLREVDRALDAQLAPLQIKLLEAHKALADALDQQAKTADAIAKNTAKFNRDADVQAAAAKLSAAQAAHAAEIKKAATTGKASYNRANALYNAVVEAMNEYRGTLDQNVKQNNKTSERSLLAFLNRDMELVLRLRDAEQSIEAAQQAIETARTELDAAHKELTDSPFYKAAIKVGKQAVSTAQGVVTRTVNKNQALRNKTVSEIAAADDAARNIGEEIDALLAPRREAERLQAVKQKVGETQAVREDRDNEQRRVEQERAERLAAIPGVKVTHENVAKLMNEVERLPEQIKALDAAAKDETASQASRNKAKYEAAAARERAKMMYGLISNNSELASAAKKELADRIAAMDVKIGDKQAAVNEPGKSASTIRSRRKELAELKTEQRKLKQLQKLAQQRSTFSPTGDAKTSTTALADELEGLQNKLLGASDDAVRAESIKQRIAIVQKELDRRDEAESRLTLERGINLETEGTTGALPPRIIGPVVKQEVLPAGMRTGNLETTEQRVTPTRNQAKQGGARKGISGEKAVSLARKDTAQEQALLNLSKIDDLIERNDAALEAAREAGNEALIAKHEGYATRLEAGQKAAQKALNDAVNGAAKLRGTSGPNDTPLGDREIDALEKGALQDVVSSIAAKSTNPIARRVAAVAHSMLGEVKVKMVDRMPGANPDAPGGISADGKTIFINRNTGLSEESLLHEVRHAVTMHMLDKPEHLLTPQQVAAKRELEKLHDATKKLAGMNNDVIRDGDLHEFVSESGASRSVQALMASTEWKPKLTMWQAFKRAVLNLLGINTPPPGNMLDRMLDLSESLMAAPEGRIQQGGEGAVMLRSAAETLASSIIAKPPTFKEKWLDNLGLSFETAAVDMRAAPIRALSKADPSQASQVSYNIRKADSRMAHLFAVLSHGALGFRKDSKGLQVIEAGHGPSAKDLFEAVKGVKASTPEAKMALAQVYLTTKRAQRVGWNMLGFEDGRADELRQQGEALMTEVNADPAQKAALENVAKVYAEYNKGLMNFMAATGALPKATAAELTKHGDYVPFYRVLKDGTAELVAGEGNGITVGNIRTQPYLRELQGGDQKLLPLNEAVIRNTMLLTDMALRNNATKSMAYALQSIGASGNKMVIKRGDGTASPNIIRFTQEPDPRVPGDDGKRHVAVETEGTSIEGIPSELLVKGLEGSFAVTPTFLKAAGWFGDVLRSGVTRSPMYVLRQLIRDPMAASFTGGLDTGIVSSVFKTMGEFGKQVTGNSKTAEEMLKRGLIHSGIFTGDTSDSAKMAMQLAGGDQSAYHRLLAGLDSVAMKADSATRVKMYESAKRQGLSDMEAEFAAMEMMNFNKRGLSPNVQYASRLIPFFNAQIQGLNVLYKAATGKMPQNERLKLQQKFFNRAMLMVGTTLLYAAAMDDDDTYKNAKARDRYNFWLIPNPAGGEHIKIPIPFEVGVLFKMLPEAMLDVMKDKAGPEEWKAVKQALLQQIPGSGSYGIPQIARPTLEVVMNHSLFSDRPIETEAQQKLDPSQRFTKNTTEFAKSMSRLLEEQPIDALQLSPLQIEHLTRGYLGGIPIAVARLTNSIFANAENEKVDPTARASDNPIYGGLFQKQNGMGAVDAAYAQDKALQQALNTYNDKIKKGDRADAAEYKEHVLDVIGAPQLAHSFQNKMNAIRVREDYLRKNEKDPDVLRAKLDELDARRQDEANSFLNAVKAVAK